MIDRGGNLSLSHTTSMIQIFLFYLLALLTQLCMASRSSEEQLNDRQYSFISAIIQNLFRLPYLHKDFADLSNPSNEQAALIRFFTELENNRGAIKMNKSFLSVALKNIKVRGYQLDMENEEDIREFYYWIVNIALNANSRKYFVSDVYTNFFAEIDDEKVTYYGYLPDVLMPIDIDAESTQKYTLADFVLGKVRRELDTDNETQRFAVSRLGNTPEILCIHVTRHDKEIQGKTVQAKYSSFKKTRARVASLKYEKVMHIDKYDYHLNGIILCKNDHYYSMVRIEDDWYLFDDTLSSKTSIEPQWIKSIDKVLEQGKRVAMLFYVRDNVSASCIVTEQEQPRLELSSLAKYNLKQTTLIDTYAVSKESSTKSLLPYELKHDIPNSDDCNVISPVFLPSIYSFDNDANDESLEKFDAPLVPDLDDDLEQFDESIVQDLDDDLEKFDESIVQDLDDDTATSNTLYISKSLSKKRRQPLSILENEFTNNYHPYSKQDSASLNDFNKKLSDRFNAKQTGSTRRFKDTKKNSKRSRFFKS